MNRLGIQSLNAGAPDLRLTGDQTQREGSYVQRRRAQMAGGGIMGSNAGSMLVAPTADGSRPGYWGLSDLWEGAKKLGQTIIPGGDPGYIPGGLYKTIGDAFISPTGAAESTGMPQGSPGQMNPYDPYGKYITGDWDPGKGEPFSIPGLGDKKKDPGFWTQLGQTIMPGGETGFIDLYGGGDGGGDPGIFRQAANIGIPLAAGKWAHDYQKDWLAKQPPFPMDETKIDFQTAQEAMADPNLRFKPKAEYANVAEGGRIGYAGGGILNLLKRLMTPEAKRFKKFEFSGGNLSSDKDMLLDDILEEMSDDIYGKPYGNLNKKQQMKISDAANEELFNIQAAEGDAALDRFKEGWAQGGRIGYQQAGSVTDIPGIPGVGKAMRDQNYLATPDGGNMVQDITMSLINSGYNPEEALKHAHQINAVESDNYPGLSKIVTSLINSGIDIEEAIKKAALIIEGSKIQSQAQGGRTGFKRGSVNKPGTHSWYLMQLNKRKGAQEGGLMNLGGMEKDYRQEGGFVPLGGEEKADDVPARLSKNEFVFTADAVRNAGGGDIDRGAEVMENLMENLEAGGEVSEDSQGLEGAQGMFANAQQLEKRII